MGSVLKKIKARGETCKLPICVGAGILLLLIAYLMYKFWLCRKKSGQKRRDVVKEIGKRMSKKGSKRR